MDVGNLISGSSAISKSSLYIWKLSVHIPLKTRLKDLKHYFASIFFVSLPMCSPAFTVLIFHPVFLISEDTLFKYFIFI